MPARSVGLEKVLFGRVALIRRSFRLDGGGERQFLNYVRAFSQLAASTSVLAADVNISNEVDGINERVRVLPLGGKRNFERRVIDKLTQGHFDFVHAHEWIPGVDSIRIGDGLHSVFLDRMRASQGIFDGLRFNTVFHRLQIDREKKTLNNSRLQSVICPTEMCLSDLYIKYPKITAKCGVVSNPINPTYLTAPLARSRAGQRLRILFVGSGWRRKGLDVLLRALAVIERPFELRVVGTDKHAQSYLRLAHKLGINQQVRWVGVKPNLVEEYEWANLLILPARYEPAGNVVLEALAMGLNVIVSEYVGSKSFITENNGLVSFGGVRELSQAIEGITINGDKDSIRGSVAHLTYERFLNDLVQFYGERP